MSIRCVRLTILSCLLLSSPLLQAQSGSHGSITDFVMDQAGMPLKGIKISARSDTQIGGKLITYSNDEGVFRFVGLHPGAFEVTAQALEMKTVVQKDVKVLLSATAEVNLVMEVQTDTEEVKVIEKAPIVSTTSASVKEVYDTDFIDGLPLDSISGPEAFVAEVSAGALDAGGTRPVRMRGSWADATRFMLEGFYMNEQRQAMRSLDAIFTYGETSPATAGTIFGIP